MHKKLYNTQKERENLEKQNRFSLNSTETPSNIPNGHFVLGWTLFTAEYEWIWLVALSHPGLNNHSFPGWEASHNDSVGFTLLKWDFLASNLGECILVIEALSLAFRHIERTILSSSLEALVLRSFFFAVRCRWTWFRVLLTPPLPASNTPAWAWRLITGEAILSINKGPLRLCPGPKTPFGSL